MQGMGPGGGPYRAEIRALFTVAMAVFLVTVVIGILNGLDLIEFKREETFGLNALLTHVHAGTLGWITLSVFAVCLWLFGESATAGGSLGRNLSWLAVVAIPLYVAAYYAGVAVDFNIVYPLRAITGAAVLLAMLGFLWWTWQASRRAPMTVPRLAVLAGLVTVCIGAIFGVLVQIQYATRGNLFPAGSDPIGAHVTAMAFSYLVLVGMAIAEWRLMPSRGLTRGGVAQVVLLFSGGLILVIAALVGMLALSMLNVIFEVVAVIIFAVRLSGPISRIAWFEAGTGRLFGASAAFVAIDILILAYLLIAYVIAPMAAGSTEPPDLASIPFWLIFALDHAIFVGVMTNAILGLLQVASGARGTLWSWADHLVFWGVNIGLVGFVVGLASETVVLKQVFSGLMGLGILLGLAVGAMRLWGGGSQQTAPAY